MPRRSTVLLALVSSSTPFLFVGCSPQAAVDANPSATGCPLAGFDTRAIAVADATMAAMGGRQAWDATRPDSSAAAYTSGTNSPATIAANRAISGYPCHVCRWKARRHRPGLRSAPTHFRQCRAYPRHQYHVFADRSTRPVADTPSSDMKGSEKYGRPWPGGRADSPPNDFWRRMATSRFTPHASPGLNLPKVASGRRMSRELDRRGLPIGDNDIWIAASALAYPAPR